MLSIVAISSFAVAIDVVDAVVVAVVAVAGGTKASPQSIRAGWSFSSSCKLLRYCW